MEKLEEFSTYIIYGAFCKILINTEKACKILKNGQIYTEKLENSLEALCLSLAHAWFNTKILDLVFDQHLTRATMDSQYKNDDHSSFHS